jgi:hypothetical protein
MSFRGPSIIKVNGGLGQQAPSDRNVAGLVFKSANDTGSALFEFQPFVLNSIDDATAKGITAAFDANNSTDSALAYLHISEFFRLNPDGKLWVLNNGGDPAFTPDEGFDMLMAASGNSIRYMGLVYGFNVASVPVVTGGFGGTVIADIAAAQAWVEAKAAEFVFVDAVVIEGIAADTTLVDLKTLDAPQVVVATGCDHGYMDAAGYDAALKKTAAVGTVLGSIGVRMLSESMGSVKLERYPAQARGQADYSLVDTRQGRWLKPGLSTGELFDDLPQAKRDDLTAKAYSYAGKYEGYPGVYLNGDATCTLVTDDFNTVHINRIWNESARRVRRALIPRMNSRVRIDPATIADWDAAAKRELDSLLAESEFADYRFTIDPAQDVIATGKVLTKLTITPQGIAKAIEGEIGFTNPAQAA